MPRSGRGGVRTGDVGQSYGNRSDLNASMPIATTPGQDYGQAAAQQAAQRAIPVAAQPVPGATAPSAAPSAPAPQSNSITGRVNPAMPSKLPGELMFDHPTERANEPITHGIDLGPGAGREAMAFNNVAANDFIKNTTMGNEPSQALLDIARSARELNF